ncbi:MAG: hypothetical protein JWN17_649 [Frankiales bacterium]|nr:hypothetical protein [Frankiales bacterium]
MTAPAAVLDAQHRLLLVLRSCHGPQATAVWTRACIRAGVLSTGDLAADELDRVCGALVETGGTCAVAAGSCRVRLLFVRARTAPAPARPSTDLQDAEVRAALAVPDAMEQDQWRRRLAELEAEVTVGAR